MQHVASIDIDCPIEIVFRKANDEMPNWSHVVVEDEVLEEMTEGVGSTFRTVTEDRGRRMEFLGVVTEYDPPYVNAVHLKGKMFDIDTKFEFDSLGDKTRVTQYAKVKGKGFFAIMMFLLGWMMKKAHCDATDQELQSLKQYCEETQAATVQ